MQIIFYSYHKSYLVNKQNFCTRIKNTYTSTIRLILIICVIYKAENFLKLIQKVFISKCLYFYKLAIPFRLFSTQAKAKIMYKVDLIKVEIIVMYKLLNEARCKEMTRIRLFTQTKRPRSQNSPSRNSLTLSDDKHQFELRPTRPRTITICFQVSDDMGKLRLKLKMFLKALFSWKGS